MHLDPTLHHCPKLFSFSKASVAYFTTIEQGTLTYGFMFHFAAVQISTFLLFQEVLEPFELVDIQRLQPDQLLSHDQRHFLSSVHPSMSARESNLMSKQTDSQFILPSHQ